MKYGPAPGRLLTPSGLIGRSVGIAQKNGIARRARRSGAGFLSSMTRFLPLTLTPEAVLALPVTTFLEPTTSATNFAAGDCMAGFRSRLIAAAKFAGPSGLPSLNFMPLRIVNV